VTSNFSGTGIESCGTALHGHGSLGRPWVAVASCCRNAQRVPRPSSFPDCRTAPGLPRGRALAVPGTKCHAASTHRWACSLTLTLALVLCELLTAAVAPLSPGRLPSAVCRLPSAAAAFWNHVWLTPRDDMEPEPEPEPEPERGRVAASRARVPAPSRGPGSRCQASAAEREGRAQATKRRPGEGRRSSAEPTPSARAHAHLTHLTHDAHHSPHCPSANGGACIPGPSRQAPISHASKLPTGPFRQRACLRSRCR
jgi:hypothetical protein